MNSPLPFVPGILMGFGMVYARVAEASIMVGQMTFSHFVLLKMFIAALAASALVHGYYYQTHPTVDIESRFFQKNTRSLNAVLIGTTVVGFGMTLSFSCPGTVYAQLGALSWMAIFTILGCLVGAFAFEYFQNDIFTLIDGKPPANPTGVGTCEPQQGLVVLPAEQNALYKILNSKFQLNLTAYQFCYYMGGALLAVVALFEILINWKKDLSQLYPTSWQDISFPFGGAPPLVAGVLIGAGQYVSLFHLDKQLGCSYTFVELAQLFYQHVLAPNLSKIPFPVANYVAASVKAPKNKPFPVTAIGITLGGFLATVLTRSLYVGRSALDFPELGRSGSGLFASTLLIIRLFFGGFVTVLGARIAGGCTSGWGVSGLGSGSTTGALATAAMFAAAIGLGVLLKVF